MTHYHEGQEVEVRALTDFSVPGGARVWRKAKIITHATQGHEAGWRYHVEFQDGTRAAFAADYIRPAEMVWMP
jgi:hypothetical protein